MIVNKYLLVLFLSLLWGRLEPQIGVNTTDPKATLDVEPTSTTGSTPEGIIAPHLTRSQLTSKDSKYTFDQKGAIVYVTVLDGIPSPKTVSIETIGYYYYDGSQWLNFSNGAWGMTGNNLQRNPTSFIGTRDAQSLIFKTSNVERMRITPQGRIGIGNDLPEAMLDISSAVGTTPLRIRSLTDGNITEDVILGVSPSGMVKSLGTGTDLLNRLSVPSPAIFKLNTDIADFLSRANAGDKQRIPMTALKIGINGMSYNSLTSTITFPSGIYQIIFVYEALHNGSSSLEDCTLSSYFIDFPGSGGAFGERIRIHSTASHSKGILSNHGGTILYTAIIPSGGEAWSIDLGRGQSGNCKGSGMTLMKNSTQLLVFKIGD